MVVLISAFTATILLSSAESLSIDSQVASEALASARKALENEQALARKDFKLVVSTSTPSGVTGVQSMTTITVQQLDLFTKKVTAMVTWPGAFNRTQNITLSSLVTNFNNAIGGDTCSSVLADATGNHGDWRSPVVTNSTFATLVGDPNVNGQYPITAVDAYQKRLYVVTALSENTGYLSPTANTPDSGGSGNGFESNPTGAYADGGSSALNTNGVGDTHRYFNYNISVPPGATITGIEVRSDWWMDSTTGTNSLGFELSWDGGATWTNSVSTSGDSTSQQTSVLGGNGDTWGHVWNSAQFNNTNFRVRVTSNCTSSGSCSSRDFNLDWLPVKVYYSKQFYIFNISNPATPTFLGGLATTTLTSGFGFNALAIATSSIGNYAYVTTNSSTGLNQLQVIDITNPAAPSVKGTYPGVAGTGMGQGVGNGIYYKDGYAYVTLTHGNAGPEFNIIDVSTPAVPVWKGGYTVGTTTNSVYVKDGYAYLTTNDSARELIVLNVTNPSNPTLVTPYNATPDSVNFGYGRALYTVGDTVYLGRSWTNSGSTPQYLALNASTPTIALLSSKSLGTNLSLRNIIVRDYLAFLLTGSGTSGGNLQIINATSTVAWGAGTVVLPPGASGQGGVAMDCEGNYIYAASVDSANRGYISAVTGN